MSAHAYEAGVTMNGQKYKEISRFALSSTLKIVFLQPIVTTIAPSKVQNVASAFQNLPFRFEHAPPWSSVRWANASLNYERSVMEREIYHSQTARGDDGAQHILHTLRDQPF